MVDNGEYWDNNDGLPAMDDSWWDSVLEEVENRYDNPQETPRNSMRKVESVKAPPSGHSIDWEVVKDLFIHDRVIKLKVAAYNRGGLLVAGEDLQGFVPASHLVSQPDDAGEEKREEIFKPYVGRTLDLKIIECDQERCRVVFSERAARAEPGSRVELLDRLEVGTCLWGEVTTVTEFGAFVDLGGMEGLIHISELSWGRVRHPGDILTNGQRVKISVLTINKKQARIALSLKRLCENPWETIHRKYAPGQITEAEITNIVPYGAFARLEEGLDGLIHMSEIIEHRKYMADNIQEGQKVKVRILHLDSSRQRLGLSLDLDGNGVE